MRRLTIGLIVLLAWPAAAQAHGHRGSHCPYGNSGWGQYGEWIPSASGCRPSHGSGQNGSHPGSSQSGGPVSPPGGGGSSSGGGGSSSGGAVTPQTAQALAQQGSAGVKAAALARATAPAGIKGLAPSRSGSGSAGHGSASHSASGGSSGAPLPSSSSPGTQLAKALTGSSGSGLGWLLPVILAAIVIGALLRRIRRVRPPAA